MKKQKLLILLAVLVLQSLAVAIDVPEVLPDPDALTPNKKIPVKVFILAGQSNMVGFGRIAGSEAGTLETITDAGMFPWLVDDTTGGWTVRNDVMYRGVISAFGDGPLTPKFGANSSHFGPELGFGHVMGYCYDEPVIVIKSSIGNRSISWDYAPPSTERFDYNGNTYAAYGESPNSWLTGAGPTPFVWYAGKQWDDCFLAESDMGAPAWADATAYPANCQVTNNGQIYISKTVHTSSAASEPGVGAESSANWNVYTVFNAADILDNFATEYPEYAAQGFEIAGYVWWQGNKDMGEPMASRYELNMVNFINDIRDYFENRYPGKIKTNAPFVLATYAENGWDMTGGALTVANGQLAAGDPARHPEFEGNVKTVEARGFWRDGSISPTTTGYHYNHNAETYMLVGDALGRAMAGMLVADNSTTARIISPTYGELVAAYPAAVTLEWENMDPNTNDATETYVDVWFGTEISTDPNNPGDYTRIVSGQNISSYTFTPPGPGKYYWQVDSYLNGDPGVIDYTDGDPCMVPGRIYMFTNDAQIKSVDILTNGTTTDTITWSGESVPLNLDVVDDGGSTLSYLWTTNAPAGVTVNFDPGPDDPAPAITITKDFGNIAIANAGFEDPVLADGDYTWNNTPGWTGAGSGVGIWNPGVPDSDGYPAYGGIAPEGENVVFVNGNTSLSQVLTETLATERTYTLSVKVGKNAGYATSTYKVELLAGDTVIAVDDNGIAATTEQFYSSEITYDSSAAQPDQIGLPLQIRLSCTGPDGGEFNFDDVQLSVTPDRPISSAVSAITVTVAVNDETNPAKTDTITLDVYDNACMATRYGLGLGAEYRADFNENCKTGLEDLAEMASAWLKDSSITEPIAK
ncbi:MAG: hypothetical protein K9M75_02355 [Phycisphaerae bacterium]|nr:hypothetical protein [Phycisphaerae bacterium]